MDDCQRFVYAAMMIKRKFVKEYDKEHKDHPLTSSEDLLVEIVSLNPGITVTDLGKKMGYNKSLVTKNMKTPLKEGYIVTKDVDGRTMSVHITPKGSECVKIGQIKRQIFVDEVFLDCTPEEKENFMIALRKLRLN